MLNLDTLIFYDVAERRVGRVHRVLAKEFFWQQRSVFAASLGKKALGRVEYLLRDVLDPAEDSVAVYQLRFPFLPQVERWGADRSGMEKWV